MNKINMIIAENLKLFRSERNLSLDKVSKLSGVSKSMLGQIERGEVNPTISTVWKIANGLKISFTELLKQKESEIEVVRLNKIEPLNPDDGKLLSYPVFHFDNDRRFETYYVEVEVEGNITAEAHNLGTEEFITVFSSELTVEVNDEVYVVRNGDSIHFHADKKHVYKNTGNEMCRMSMIIYYSEKN